MNAVWVVRNQLALHDQPADHKYKMITQLQNEAGNSLLIIIISMFPDKCLRIFFSAIWLSGTVLCVN